MKMMYKNETLRTGRFVFEKRIGVELRSYTINRLTSYKDIAILNKHAYVMFKCCHNLFPKRPDC